MFEFLTGTGLAAAAGLNAYVPLLLLGLSSRLLEIVELPPAWSWLENEWVLGVIAVLLVLEIVADKIPAVDSVNDWIQTIVRPASGGIVFGSGSASETALVDDPAAFFSSDAWVPVVLGILFALVVHLGKMSARPIANMATAGLAAPVVSTVEDLSSIVLTVLALLAPVLVIVGLAGLVTGFVLLVRRMRRRRRELGRDVPAIPRPSD
jgi:hypothetical protein